MRAADEHNVSALVITVDGVAQNSSLERLASDFRGNVTFTATNLFRLTNSCTISIATFTTQITWGKRDMDVGGERNATVTAQNTTPPIYYVNSSYSVAGPAIQHNFDNSKLFENYNGKANEIVFEVSVTPPVRGLVYIDQQSGDVIISPTDLHLQTEAYRVVLQGRDTTGAQAKVYEWDFTVQKRPAFKVQTYTRESDKSAAVEITNVTGRALSPFPVNKTFNFAPVILTAVTHADIGDGITFTLGGNATGLFINPATGAVQGVVRMVGLYQVVLLARDK